MNDPMIGYGVSRQSVVPVRAEPSDRAEQVTQLLFGDHYCLLTKTRDGKWLRIRIAFDDYEGWIDIKQHHPISAEYFDFINEADFKITTDVVSDVLYNKMTVPIVMGSILPVSASELFRMEEHFAFGGASKSLSQRRGVDFLLETATRYIHAPYSWGGKSPFGIDCSGFTQMVFRIAGYPIARDTRDQFGMGKPVEPMAARRAGDLAFFKDTQSAIRHVGILTGEGRIIHASGSVRIDHLDDEGIVHAETGVHTHELAGIRRVLPEPTRVS